MNFGAIAPTDAAFIVFSFPFISPPTPPMNAHTNNMLVRLDSMTTHKPEQVGAGMGALGVEGLRRGEFVNKRVTFHAIAADPTLDGGLAACCVFNNSNSQATVAAAAAAGRGKDLTLGTGISNGSGGNGNGTVNATSMEQARLTVAGAGRSGATAPPNRRGRTQGGRRALNGIEDEDNNFAGVVDDRKSFVFVWPRRLEATAEAGLQAAVPYRLTCLRLTAFGDRFKDPRNALLAGTRDGIALAFDWGCLLRDSGGGGGGQPRSPREDNTLRPCAQVR